MSQTLLTINDLQSLSKFPPDSLFSIFIRPVMLLRTKSVTDGTQSDKVPQCVRPLGNIKNILSTVTFVSCSQMYIQIHVELSNQI